VEKILRKEDKVEEVVKGISKKEKKVESLGHIERRVGKGRKEFGRECRKVLK